jgi:hypothetical protein
MTAYINAYQAFQLVAKKYHSYITIWKPTISKNIMFFLGICDLYPISFYTDHCGSIQPPYIASLRKAGVRCRTRYFRKLREMGKRLYEAFAGLV